MNLEDITQEQLQKAYDQHPPKEWLKFTYKYFSKSTLEEDLAPKRFITVLFMVLFLGGFLGTILKWDRNIMAPIVITYSVTLALFVFYLLVAVFSNNARINKIRRILGVTKQQYNYLVDKLGLR
jgi:hypothetical protein